MSNCVSQGVHLGDLEPGSVVEVVTRSRCYRIQCRAGGETLISGHPGYCPQPVNAHIGSSDELGGLFVAEQVFVGMHVEARCGDRLLFRTSAVAEVRVC